MANIVTTQTNEQRVAAQIDAAITQAFTSQVNAYHRVMQLVNANQQFKDEYNAFDPEAVYTAFAANTKLSMTATDLQNFAKVSKAVLNLAQPATIGDDGVTAATITL